LEKEVKKLVSEGFYKWIHVFGKKASERMPMRKVWNHMIEIKKGFVSKKEKLYLLSRRERGEIYEFIEEQLRKEYIRPLKMSQMVPVFFVEKKDGKKMIV